jgi:hypothetical protein
MKCTLQSNTLLNHFTICFYTIYTKSNTSNKSKWYTPCNSLNNRLVNTCCFAKGIGCLIHNAHLGKILIFLQNFRSKNNSLKENSWLIFLFNIYHCNSGLAFKSKDYYITSQNWMYFIMENSQNLWQKRKWALWMRHWDPNVVSLIVWNEE